MSQVEHMTKVQGVCPACGWDDVLYLNHFGYIKCCRVRCPEPWAVSDLLDMKKEER